MEAAGESPRDIDRDQDRAAGSVCVGQSSPSRLWELLVSSAQVRPSGIQALCLV